MSVAKNSPLPRSEMDALLLGRLDELTVSNDSNSRGNNYLGIIVSVVVLMLISSMIVAAIVIINPEIVTFATKPYVPREAITLEESMLGELSPNSFSFQWLSSQSKDLKTNQPFDELLFEDSKNLNYLELVSPEQQLNASAQNVKVTLATNNFKPDVNTLIANTSLLASIEYQGFKISPSKRYLLIWTTKRKQFRHTFTAKYFLYDIKLDLIFMLSTRNQATGDSYFEHLDSATQYLNDQDEGNEHNRFQLVDWFAKDDEDALILIQNNDIYLLNNIAGNQQETASEKGRPAILPTRLTFTGKSDEVFNGIPDWLYEEEVLGDTQAFQVSPKASTLAYMSFNDSLVDKMPFSIYGSGEVVIPKSMLIRYPKAGRVNPQVSVHLVDNLASVDSRRSIQLQLPDNLGSVQHYINRIKWLTEDKLVIVWLNRSQNESYFLICSRQTDWKCEKNIYLKEIGGWLDVLDDIYPLNDDHYITLLPAYEGYNEGSFKHIARISINQQNTYTFLTKGKREVTSINGLDKEKGAIYYTSTVENEPGQRQLFAAHLYKSDNVEIHIPDTCLTCHHYPEECKYNYARMSKSTKFYIFECEGPGIPRVELRSTENSRFEAELYERQQAFSAQVDVKSNKLFAKIALHSPNLNDNLSSQKETDLKQRSTNSSLLWTIEDNQVLKDKLTYTKAMPLTMRLKVPIPNTNYSANVIMLLPPQLGSTTNTFRSPSSSSLPSNPSAQAFFEASGKAQSRVRGFSQSYSSGLERPLHVHFSPESIGQYTNELAPGEQYPAVVDVYAGPSSQKVDYRFHVGFGHYLASSRRTIYIMIDGRGSGYQGTNRLFELYHKLGTVEIQDQIEVAAYLVRNFSFIDPAKVAIWGWSYGGYASAMALAKSNELAMTNLQTLMKELQLKKSGYANLNTTTIREGPVRVSESGSNALRGVFECAASVAPVTNWIYYDTAYTERYMSSPYQNELFDQSSSGDHATFISNSHQIFIPTPTSSISKQFEEPTSKWLPLNQTFSRIPLVDLQRATNQVHKLSSLIELNERYKRASLLEHIVNIDRKRFLLIHGTADDNVHFQQSIMLMKRLIQKNIMYETRLYPDQDHGIGNKADKLHLFTTLSNFFAECFDMAH